MRSKLRHTPLFLAIIFLLAPALFAQESWEGSAIVGRYGEFPPGGLYAASNAFPLNSVIEVTNPDTGRTQRLIVAQRAENSGVLLVVSQTAAEELGVSRRATFRVQIEPVEMPPLTSVSPSEDLPFHPDPDINPRAALGNPNAALLQPGVPGAAAAETPEISGAETPSERPIAEAAPEEPAPEPEEPAPEPEEPAPPEEPVEPEAIVEAEKAPEEAPTEAPAETPAAEEPAEEPEPEAAPESAPAPPVITALPEAEKEPEPEAPEGLEGPGEKELFPPAPESELYAALPSPDRPEEPPVVTELPIAPVEEALDVEASSLGPRFPNPLELMVELPQPPGVETPDAVELAPRRPEVGEPEAPLAMATPGEASGPDMSEEVPRPTRRPEGPVTEIPLRIADEPEPAEPEPEPAEPESEPAGRPAAEPREEIVALEPAEFRPPEEPRVAEVTEPPGEAVSEAPPEEPEEAPAEAPAPVAREPEPEARPSELPLSAGLPGEGYYLQVGAFSDPRGAQAAVNQLGDEFPVKVVPSDGEIYRVFVGPLEEDERGAVLYLVRARGYRDAFLRSTDG